MPQSTLEVLLHQIFSIQKKYEGITKITGENYNIFRILKVHSKEVRLHSAVLADLLNPRGTHEQGDVFLKLFLKLFWDDFKINYHFTSENAKVVSECYIGEKTEDEGGIIDILGTDARKRHFIIENKIYAGDQENQLIRYHKFGKGAPLFYLTLFGKEPLEFSKGIKLKKGEDFYCISYKNDIINWLEKCKKETVNYPILRETITQYINLLKYLTNQSTNQKMSEDIASQIIRSEDTLKAYFEAYGSMENVKDAIFDRLERSLKEMADNNKNLFEEFEYKLDRRNPYEQGFQFSTEKLKNMNLLIRFEFNENNLEEFNFGYKWINASEADFAFRDRLQTKIKEMTICPEEDFDDSASWPAYCKWNNPDYYCEWGYDTYLEIISGEFCKKVEEKFRDLLQKANVAFNEK